ncbi:MAG: ABC transporter permease subunit [Clostridia bacterium]|nr:ABC transporter permease subunit [Clostridia bacterium]
MGFKHEKNWLRKSFDGTVYAMKSVYRWCKRAFFGGNKGLKVEQIETPTRLLRERFFRKKAAVGALVFLLVLFLFVFIAPAFVGLDMNYTDPLQQNVAPVYSLRKLPRALKKQIAYIDGFSGFTVGMSAEGEVFVWGNGQDKLNGTDMKDVPKQILDEGARLMAAGKDHALVLTRQGSLIGWGDKSCGQYGTEALLNVLPMPQELTERLNGVAQIVCGYQASGLVKEDGRGYLWGNTNAVRNLPALNDRLRDEKIRKICFTNSIAVSLLKDGRIEMGLQGLFQSAISSHNGRINQFDAYMVGRKAVDIAANNKCLAVLLEDGELLVTGAFENGEDRLPALVAGEYFTSLDGGTRHFVGVSNFGNVYAWGDNAYGQCDVNGMQGDAAYAGALQSYVVSEGKLLKASGLKGYLMGTDGRGRDVFARIVHGGKMTLTIGGVAVIVSSLIAILVGCIAGYFGGWVDLLLMRVTEIFSSIPFLPFAMLLSQIIKNYNVSETLRIVIIMLILGALSWTGLARIIRGQVLAEREKEFVTAARAMGVKEVKIAFKHVLPNIISVVLVSMTLDFAGCLLTESSLSYLGFGVQPPRPTWGNMLSGSNSSIVIQHYWWQWLFPALFLSLAVICINVIGDALQDVLNPKGKGD